MGAVLRELGSSESIKSIATAMASTGAVSALGNTVTMEVNGVQVRLNGISLANGASPVQLLGRNLVNGVASTTIGTAINGGDLGDNLTAAISNAFVSTARPWGPTRSGPGHRASRTPRLSMHLPARRRMRSWAVTGLVRAYTEVPGESRQAGSWLMRAEDIAGLSREQIASRFALPQVPTMVTDANIPAGINMNVSVANGVSPNAARGIYTGGNGGGGAVQYQITTRVNRTEFETWFTNPRSLR